MKYVFFFATSSDIVPALKNFEANKPLKFVDPEIKTTPHRAIYFNSSDIPSLGIATAPSGSWSDSYIVSYRDVKNHMHAFVDNYGQKRWMINNGDNPDSVMLTLAGVWKTGTLLPGNICTSHQAGVAQQLMRCFLLALKEASFVQLDIYWLGPEALEMLKAGRRLAKNAEASPPQFDLQLPDSLRRH